MANSRECMDFRQKNVNYLQNFLKNRGVCIHNSRKEDLINLCRQADRLDIEIDPDGLFEDRGATVREKLTLTGGHVLTLPTLKSDITNQLAKIPVISVFDILQHLGKGHSYSDLRNHRNLEGYGMFKDGFVADVQACHYHSDAPSYSAVVGKVKPRTNSKDPNTGLPFYICWVIFCSDEDAERVYSAFCSCRGGIDGFCRHVTAVLFELMDFIGEESKKSCTSEPCMWNRRKSWVDQPLKSVQATDLETSILQDKVDTIPLNRTLGHASKVLPPSVVPDVNKFFEGLPKVAPSAVMNKCKREVREADTAPTLAVKTPEEKLATFKEEPGSHSSVDFCQFLQYSAEEISHIERATVGQSSNPHWIAMRKQVLTASSFKTVCHSVDLKKTAQSIVAPRSLDDKCLPAPLQYGRKNEKKARGLFTTSHRFQHKKCVVKETGLFFSTTIPYLGCSPDGIADCCVCGRFVLEIKCLWKHRNYHPKAAGKMSGLLVEKEDGTLSITPNHAYHYQIMGQMGVTNIKKAVLVIYTNKGIFPVFVPFDGNMWSDMTQKFSHFYHTALFPVIFSASES